MLWCPGRAPLQVGRPLDLPTALGGRLLQLGSIWTGHHIHNIRTPYSTRNGDRRVWSGVAVAWCVDCHVMPNNLQLTHVTCCATPTSTPQQQQHQQQNRDAKRRSKHRAHSETCVCSVVCPSRPEPDVVSPWHRSNLRRMRLLLRRGCSGSNGRWRDYCLFTTLPLPLAARLHNQSCKTARGTRSAGETRGSGARGPREEIRREEIRREGRSWGSRAEGFGVVELRLAGISSTPWRCCEAREDGFSDHLRGNRWLWGRAATSAAKQHRTVVFICAAHPGRRPPIDNRIPHALQRSRE
mmetsp:Transcript_7910/g.17688  ORF Transcript_7910/g.17688 Transcript_7910/m.17688 type:complete len:297 (-) Transcript_7910:3-893(-)